MFEVTLLQCQCTQLLYFPPGSGLDFVEYDLLTIEDDVVFGSRSVVGASQPSTRAMYVASIDRDKL